MNISNGEMQHRALTYQHRDGNCDTQDDFEDASDDEKEREQIPTKHQSQNDH